MSIVKWAAAKSWGDRPTKKEYVRETEHFYVRADKRRDAKISSYARYFDTEAEAIEFIADRKAKRIRSKEIDQIKRHAVELLEALENLVNADSVTMHDAMSAAELAIEKSKSPTGNS